MTTPSEKSQKIFYLNPEISLLRNGIANFVKLIGITLVLASVALTFSGPLLLVFSIYQYFNTGEWIYYDNGVILYCFSDLREWLRQPHSWFGLHKIAKWMFDYLPLGLLTVPLGLILAILSAAIFNGMGMGLHEKPLPTVAR